MKILPFFVLIVLSAGRSSAESPPLALDVESSERLYRQTGEDPTFAELVAKEKLPAPWNSKEGVAGSKIRVNRKVVEALPQAKNPIPEEIRLHTLLHHGIPRQDFGEWSRWYQEDGNTQIFRLFAGEKNLATDRDLAARVEAYTELKWSVDEGEWHEWSGVVTGINASGTIFQVKAFEEGPAMMIGMNPQGDVKFNPRRAEGKILARGMNGKPFHLRVRDNGHDYEVFYNGELAGTGSYPRPKGRNAFRWGFYVGAREVPEDTMILFSGVTIDGRSQ